MNVQTISPSQAIAIGATTVGIIGFPQASFTTPASTGWTKASAGQFTVEAPSGVASLQVNETGLYLKENDLGIPAFDMSIESQTTKLGWLLAQNMNYEQIKMKMLEDLHWEINIENELI